MGRYSRIDTSYDAAAKAATTLGARSMSFVKVYMLSRATPRGVYRSARPRTVVSTCCLLLFSLAPR